jgi:TolB-like protein
MKWIKHSHRLLLLFALLATVAMLAALPATAQEGTVAEKLEQALKNYNDLDYELGIKEASGLLERGDLTADDSVAIYEVLGIITYARGEAYIQQAFRYLDKISQIGPCVVPMPRDLWPQEMRDRWYKIVEERGKLTCDEPTEQINTIAIMPFDNFSTGEWQEKLGLLSKGLSDFFAFDFAKISDFKVIERDKLSYVLKEHELQASGKIDKATAIQAGKILAAKYMVFGSITQIDKNTSRMIVRVVNVETTEIIAQADREGKPEFSSMEKDLVKDLADKLAIKLTDNTLKMIDEGGSDNLDAATYYSMGLDYMDKYDYKLAYENFKKAYDMDSSFFEAKRKMEIYRPLAG